MQVLGAEDPTTLCTDAKAVAGRQSLIAVLIPLPDNIMSFMRVSLSHLPMRPCVPIPAPLSLCP